MGLTLHIHSFIHLSKYHIHNVLLNQSTGVAYLGSSACFIFLVCMIYKLRYDDRYSQTMKVIARCVLSTNMLYIIELALHILYTR